jgi:hypothetical protein
MATRFDVVRTIKNPSLRVVGGLLRRPPIEVDEHLYYFHYFTSTSLNPLIMHSTLLSAFLGQYHAIGNGIC